MDIIVKLTEEFGVKKVQIEQAVKLIDEGNTVPFIARYRKDVTGGLNDEQLRAIDERLRYLRGLRICISLLSRRRPQEQERLRLRVLSHLRL